MNMQTNERTRNGYDEGWETAALDVPRKCRPSKSQAVNLMDMRAANSSIELQQRN